MGNTKGVWAVEWQRLSFRKTSLWSSSALRRKIFTSLLIWNWNNKKQTSKWQKINKQTKKGARSHRSRGSVTLNTLERTNHSLGVNYSHYCNGAFGEGLEGEGKGYFVFLAFISTLLLPWFELRLGSSDFSSLWPQVSHRHITKSKCAQLR